MKIVLRLLALLVLTFGTPAMADMTATYVGLGGVFTMRVEIATNGDFRVSTSSPAAYAISRNGHLYLVQATFNGPAVMRIEDVATVTAEVLHRAMPAVPPHGTDNVPALQLDQGCSVTIRGRSGTAYYLGLHRQHTASEMPTLVISDNPSLAPLGTVMQRQFDMSVTAAAQMLGHNNPWLGMQEVLLRGTPIVFAGAELDTVSNEPIPVARFALPAEPLDLAGVRTAIGAPPL